MGVPKLIKEIEKISCTKNKGHKFKLSRVLSSGKYVLECRECAKKGLSDIIVVEIKGG